MRLLTPRSQRNNDLLDSFNRGYISLPDIAQQLEKETGIRLGEGVDQ